MVASEMKDISLAQQKLAYNQGLPPNQFQRFAGAPDQFPQFKQVVGLSNGGVSGWF